MLITHLQLVPRSKNVDLYIHYSIRLHDLVLQRNWQQYVRTRTSIIACFTFASDSVFIDSSALSENTLKSRTRSISIKKITSHLHACSQWVGMLSAPAPRCGGNTFDVSASGLDVRMLNVALRTDQTL
jgi:hypothetical protein